MGGSISCVVSIRAKSRKVQRSVFYYHTLRIILSKWPKFLNPHAERLCRLVTTKLLSYLYLTYHYFQNLFSRFFAHVGGSKCNYYCAVKPRVKCYTFSRSKNCAWQEWHSDEMKFWTEFPQSSRRRRGGKKAKKLAERHFGRVKTGRVTFGASRIEFQVRYDTDESRETRRLKK